MSQPRSPLEDLIEEGRRQLTICNACRYCEGYCSVWPALERRRELTEGDLTFLANLCHDCRDCLDACMYASPHEFELNAPALFSELRLSSRRLNTSNSSASRRRVRTTLAVLAVAFVLVALLTLNRGITALWASHARAASPYSVMSYVVLVVAMAIPFVWGLGEATLDAARYWRDTRSPLRTRGFRAFIAAAGKALGPAASLRNLGGGGAGCDYPTERPSGWRRTLHHFVAYGFGLCVISTLSAAVQQDILGHQPPFPLLSVPVMSGTVGGIGIAIGCAGLARLKLAARIEATNMDIRDRDFAFILSLEALAITGLCTLLLRTSRAFGPMLVIHLAIVAVCFAFAPYSKFTHAIKRYLALVQDQIEGS